MNRSGVTTDGLVGERPDREATTGVVAGRMGGRRRDLVVPDARFQSYYGQPVLNAPVWEARDIAGYLFLGGLAGASSVLAAGGKVSGRPVLVRATATAAAGSIGLSLVALVHDLGRPGRFFNMLRVFKPTSPMSVGSWVLAAYAPAALGAAVLDWTGRRPELGRAATFGAGLLGPVVAGYTAALVADTAVPVWHDSHRQLPFVFVGSAAAAAGGLGLVIAPPGDDGPCRRFAVGGAITELCASEMMKRSLESDVAKALDTGRAGKLLRVSTALSVAGLAGALVSSRLRGPAARVTRGLSGGALVAASACTRFGIFHAGMASANDPLATTAPQRRRLEHRAG